MPELPEVETVRRSLQPLLPGRTITGVEVASPVVTLPDSRLFSSLRGVAFGQIDRRGKYLLFRLSDGRTLTVHLRMTGQLLWRQPEQPRDKHTHVVLQCEDMELRFVDVRRFGRLWLTPESEISGLCTLGKEPIDATFDHCYLERALSRHPRANLKGAILDQTVVAGLGNIYADESLFAAGLHPLRKVASLTQGEICALAQAMTEVLQRAIAHRGTSFRDYVDAAGEKGDNQQWLQIFLREGQPCLRCGATVERIKVVGRSSYYCPCCQQLA